MTAELSSLDKIAEYTSSGLPEVISDVFSGAQDLKIDFDYQEDGCNLGLSFLTGGVIETQMKMRTLGMEFKRVVVPENDPDKLSALASEIGRQLNDCGWLVENTKFGITAKEKDDSGNIIYSASATAMISYELIDRRNI